MVDRGGRRVGAQKEYVLLILNFLMMISLVVVVLLLCAHQKVISLITNQQNKS
jgi:hypothetical protein